MIKKLNIRNYPADYFDPHASGPQYVECVECGESFCDDEEITGVEAFECLERGTVFQGTCINCMKGASNGEFQDRVV